MTYKDSLDIVPDTSPTSLFLPESDFDRLKTMNDSIKNALIDMTNEHQSDTKTVNDNISDMLQKLTAANYKKSKHEEQFTDISSKLSYYEDRLNKMSIKDTYIQTLSLQIINTSPKTYRHEEKIT